MGTGIDVEVQNPEAVTTLIQEFQHKYAGKRPAEAMHIKIGDTPLAIIQGGTWRSSGLSEVEGGTREVLAVCNGLICDKRLVFLKECIDQKVTGNRYEAHYDQKLHEDDIRDAAGRQDRLLKLTLREEVTLRKTTLHITNLEVIYPGDLDFMLSSPGQVGHQ